MYSRINKYTCVSIENGKHHLDPFREFPRHILNHLGESTSRSSILLSSHVNIMFSNDGEVEQEREKGAV